MRQLIIVGFSIMFFQPGFAGQIPVRVSLPSVFKINQPKTATGQYDFTFVNDDYSLRVVNELINGETILAALNEENVVMALGYGNCSIRKQLQERSLYVMTPKTIKNINELKGKRIITLEGTGQFYYLKKLIKYIPVSSNQYEALKAIDNNFTFENKPVDGVLLDENLVWNLKNKNAFRISGGHYYMVANKKGDNLVWYNDVNLVLKNNGLIYTPMTAADLNRVTVLSKYISEKDKNKRAFKRAFNDLERFILNLEKK